MVLFFFPFLWKKLHFFHSSSPKLLLLQWNKSPSPACTGGAARWEQGAGGPSGFPAFPCSAAMQGKAEMIQRLNTAMEKTSASPASGSSQLQERVNAFLFWRSWCHGGCLSSGVLWEAAAGEGRVACEQIPLFKGQALMGQECCSCKTGKTKQFCFAGGPHQRWLQRAHDPPIHHLPESHMRRWDNYYNFNVLHDDLNTLGKLKISCFSVRALTFWGNAAPELLVVHVPAPSITPQGTINLVTALPSGKSLPPAFCTPLLWKKKTPKPSINPLLFLLW